MDRLIAQYTVPVGSGDTAPATGTPGQATGGNPATNTPATRMPAYAWNAIQEELMAVLAAGGIVADRTNNAQVVAAIRRLVQTKTVLVDGGSANAYSAANTPPLTALPSSGFVQVLSIANANTGASTYAPDGLAAKPILGMGLAALQSGELSVKGIATLLYVVASNVNSGNGAWILIECTGGAQQISAATASTHAVQFSQVASALGAVNARAYTAAASSFTLTADRVVAVTAAAGGLAYATSGFNKAINLATTGAGGMDTGSAPTSGYVAIYAIYNPTTTTWALLATNATSAAAPEVYAGANMPSGYTASCLVSVWGTTSTANQFRAGLQRGRHIAFPPATALSSTTPQASYTALSISTIVPPNALGVTGYYNPQSSATSSIIVAVAADSNGTDENYGSVSSAALAGGFRCLLATAQTIYYKFTSTAGTPQIGINVAGYEF